LPKTEFLSHNFVPDVLASQSRALKTRFRVTNQKTLSEKNSHWAGAQGQAKAPKISKHALIVT